MTTHTTDARSDALPDAVRAHATRLAPRHLRDLLAADPGRWDALALEAGPLLADFSRQRIDVPALRALEAWAAARGFEARRADLFAGRVVNPTENRPALHTALRGVGGDAAAASAIAAQRGRMAALARRLRDGGLPGFRGAPVRALVCLGIGGSDLGPRLVVDALHEPGGLDVRFVANVDPDDLHRALEGLDPATTAFAIVSKTFTTRETLANADAARAWLVAGGCPPEAVAGQTIAVTAAPAAALARGMRAELLLEFWEWVGGRFSLWSTVGIGIAAACGPEAFDALLDGAAAIDRHFRDAPLESNLPARVGLVSLWNRACLGLPTQATIPYAERLRLLPAWQQQLVMESNGKSATLDGGRVALPTSPVVWGTSGTNAQHSFFQQLHQGPDVVPVDFVVAREPRAPSLGDDDPRHRILVANCLAQAAALALGRPSPDGDAHREFPGDRPSTVFVLPRVDAHALGALLACHEHATFTAAAVLGINPFDQFGVEYGKVMATSVEALLAGGAGDGLDAATRALAARLGARPAAT
ncbi:MAG TPA: glucose-6-phosphate isomerase [Burkholderiaceae bacterium]|nr:glucose-6-phosphate isomerase [Burkholderiaceae bacterium]